MDNSTHYFRRVNFYVTCRLASSVRNTSNPELRKSHSFKVEKNVSGNHNRTFANPSYIPARNTNTGCHPPISCYGCSNPALMKSGCPNAHKKRECLCQRLTDVHLSYLRSSST
ncbi:hypothetical protein TNCV_3704261 [Trichonephila clavipes]|nr:hypothetical protein TNCV_3704261 [Trichonephila clavipes]